MLYVCRLALIPATTQCTEELHESLQVRESDLNQGILRRKQSSLIFNTVSTFTVPACN